MGLLGALGASACLSPTLPLPPPSRPDISPPDISGLATLKGVVPSESTVFAENRASGQIVGQITGESGRYELQLPAEIGDRVNLWYRQGTEASSVTQLIVPSEGSSASLPDLAFGGAGGSN